MMQVIDMEFKKTYSCTISEETKLADLERIKEELKELLPLLSKGKVEQLQKQISHFYLHKWKQRRIPKYGSVNKGFTEEELEKFLGVIKDDRFRLLFEFQGYLALRVGEVCKVNMQDFNFKTRELKVHTEKAHTLDTLLLPQFLYDETLEYIKAHTHEIDDSLGYIFYPNREKSHNKKPYINLNYVRRIFRYYTSLAGLDEIYDTSEESLATRPKRELHRLTTHSLRHFGITHFSKAVNGNIILTNRFARHSKESIAVTMGYINTSKEELYGAIEKAFCPNDIQKIKVNL